MERKICSSGQAGVRRSGAFAPPHADLQLRPALGQAGVDPDAVWAKLAAMAEGGADRLAQALEILGIRLG